MRVTEVWCPGCDASILPDGMGGCAWCETDAREIRACQDAMLRSVQCATEVTTLLHLTEPKVLA